MAWDSQSVSDSKRHSTRTLPSSLWKRMISPLGDWLALLVIDANTSLDYARSYSSGFTLRLPVSSCCIKAFFS